MGVRKSLFKLHELLELAEVGEVARRYFAINMFDQILTIIGILIASFFAGVQDLRIVILATFGAAIAMTVSGVWGAYLTEMAERGGKIKQLERKLSINLKKSPITQAHKLAAWFLGIIDGVLPLLATPLMIFPLFLDIPVNFAYYYSLALSFFMLFIIGTYLGKISKENLLKSGIKMVAVGIICVVIIFLFELLLK